MPFKRQNAIADETFEADNLEDSLQGAMDYLDSKNVPDGNNDPETIIILRNNIPGKDGQRTFSGSIYVGKSIDQIKNDFQ